MTARRLRTSAWHWGAVLLLACLTVNRVEAQLPPLVSDRPSGPGATEVKIGVYYIDISDIDESSETFSATVYLLLEWSDPRLRSLDSHAGTRLFKPDQIWTPAIELINAGKLQDQQPPTCIVTTDGTVYYSRRVAAVLNTPMDLRRFPFDRQQLNLTLESARYGADEVTFRPDPDQSGLGRDIVPRGWTYSPLMWNVTTKPFANTQQSYSRLVFSFAAKRNPSYFIWKIVVPTAIFVLLTWSIFWMEVREVQTALLISITILLTAVAFAGTTDTVLPKLGYRTWLDQFQIGSFLFIVLAVVESMAANGLHLAGRGSRALTTRRWFRLLYPIAYGLFSLILWAADVL